MPRDPRVLAQPFQNVGSIASSDPFTQSPLVEQPGFTDRLLSLPERALRFIPGSINELIGTPTANRQQFLRDEQRRIAQGLLGGGVVPEFSPGKRSANKFTLGLTPGNERPQINPEGLTIDQREQFDNLTPMQQRLVTARRPEDYASIIQDDELFPERAATSEDIPFNNPALIGTLAKDFTPESIQEARRTNDAGALLNSPPTKDSPLDNPALIGTLAKEFTPESVEIARRTGNISGLVRATSDESLAASFKLQADKLAAVTPMRESFLRNTTGFRKMAEQYRTFIGSYGQNPNMIPPDIAAVLKASGRDLSKLGDSGIRDIAFVFQFMKALDPESTVRESEGRMVVTAASVPESLRAKIEHLLNGDLLAPETRNEIFRTIRDIVGQNLRGLEIARDVYRASATRNKLDPDDVTLGDGLVSDVRDAFAATDIDAKPSREQLLQDASDAGIDVEDPEKLRAFLMAKGVKKKSESRGE